MNSTIQLGVLGVFSVVALLFVGMVSSSHTNTPTGNVLDTPLLSQRMCPPGFVSILRGSPPMYPGGEAKQQNVFCVPKDAPIEAEGQYFVHNNVPPFNRFSQDQAVRRYDG